MKRLIFVALVVACNSKDKQCQKALDWLLEDAPKQIEKSLASAPESERETMRLQAGKEVRAEREKFVDACKAEPEFDLDCYTDPTKHVTEPCRNMRQRIDTVVMKGI